MRILILLLLVAMSYGVQAGQTKTIPVIDRLAVVDLSTGRHDFNFRAGYRNTGEAILIPVIVIKGAKTGPHLMLTAAVHGDELNGIRVIHKLVAQIKPEKLSGTVIAIPGLNRTGIENNSRYFHESNGGGAMTDLNRSMPGRETGSAGYRYAYKVWHKLLKPNADIAIDLHTQTRGTEYPLYVFSDFRNKIARKMAYLLGPDIIKQDEGEKGTVETTFMENGVPAVTLEIGAPKRFQEKLISRALDGIIRVMQAKKMLDGTIKHASIKPYLGKKAKTVYTHKGGILVLKVKLLDSVKAGQKLGCLYDSFGYLLKCYKAPFNGRVLAIATDPMREPGAMVARIIK